MKRSVVVSVMALAVASAAWAAPAGQDAAAAFDKIKALAGAWEGKDSEGHPVTLTYKVTSGGSAVMEEMSHENMITMYHVDGNRLMLTHYCGAQNQPRMRTAPVTGEAKSLEFKFVDATGLAKPTDGHMHGLLLSFVDADHITEQWTFSKDGKDDSHTFAFARKK